MRYVRLSWISHLTTRLAVCLVVMSLLVACTLTSLQADEEGKAHGPLLAANAKIIKLAGGFKFVEGPAVNAAGDIFFSDIPNKRIHKWSVAENKLSTFSENSGGSNGLYFAADGKLYACETVTGRVSAISPDGKEASLLAGEYKGKRFNKPNDLWIDTKGGVYFTDPNYGRQPLSQDGEHVYYISPDRKTVTRVVDDLKKPNGIVGTADGKRLYIADPGAKKTYSYTIKEDGSLADKKLFASTGSDGMTLDENGNLYITSGGVQVYDPEGHHISSIKIPEGPSNVCFGGKDGKTLFITARTSFYSLNMAVAGMNLPGKTIAAAGATSGAANTGGGGGKKVDGAKMPTKVIKITTIPEMMRYDVTEFTVYVNQKVKIVFKNEAYEPHNIMFIMPGKAEEVALQAEKMGEEGFIKHFRPDNKNIMHASKMLDFEDSQTLEFTAPAKAGEYDYICTFPMHWKMMRGMMHVIDGTGKTGGGPKKPPTRIEWTLKDLAKDLPSIDHGSSFEKGKTTFTKLGCVSCHKIKGEGGLIGPELTEVFKKWKGKREDVLREILDPSKTVEEKYRSHLLTTSEGERLFGLVTERSKDYLMIVTNPANPIPQKVLLDDILEQKITPNSPMPKGLLATLKRQEILDLLAYIEAGGDGGHKLYKHKHNHN